MATDDIYIAMQRRDAKLTSLSQNKENSCFHMQEKLTALNIFKKMRLERRTNWILNAF